MSLSDGDACRAGAWRMVVTVDEAKAGRENLAMGGGGGADLNLLYTAFQVRSAVRTRLEMESGQS